MFSVKDRTPVALKSMVVKQFSCAGCNSRYIGETSRHFSTRIKEHTESDKNSHIFKHFNTSPICKSKYSPSCFSILDSASNSIDLKLKEAFHINKIKPELNNCSITTLFSHFSLHLDVWCHAVNSTRFCITSCCNNFWGLCIMHKDP